MKLKINHKNDLLAVTNTQRVLAYLVDHPAEDLCAAEIQKATGLSKAGTYRSLNELSDNGVAVKSTKGGVNFYRIVEDDCFVRQYKVLKTVMFLKPLVGKLRSVSREVIFFGSASRGEDFPDSDIDLFIMARDPDAVQKTVSAFKTKKKLQSVIKTAVDMAQMEAGDPEFIREIRSGVLLWREKRDA